MSYVPNQFPQARSKSRWVKLGLEGCKDDGPFVRVQLPVEIGPNVVETLRNRSLDLWKVTEGALITDIQDVKVFLTYRDAENDLCFIFSEEDLICALPEDGAPLRLFARLEGPATSNLSRVSPQASVSSQPVSNERSFADIPVHKVVEAVVGVLTAASVALQTHVRKDSPAISTHTTCASTPPSSATLSSRSTAEEGGKVQHVVKSAPDEKCPSPSATFSQMNENSESRPFIHGRHTCDACLLTPIVGKRYHALNMPDYDLCAACKDNYKGADIIFEEVELDRDRPMQERWARRFDKWTKKQERQQEKCAARESKNSDPTPPCGPPHGPPFGPPHPHGPAFGPPSHGHPFGPPPHGPPFGPPPHGPPFGPPPHGPPFAHQPPHGPAFGPPPSHGPPFGHSSCPPFGPPHPHHQGPPFWRQYGHGNHPRRCRGARHWNHGGPFGSFPEQGAVQPNHADQDLEEAIRRSIVDMHGQEAATVEKSEEKEGTRNSIPAPSDEASKKTEEESVSSHSSPRQSGEEPNFDVEEQLVGQVMGALGEAGRALKNVGPVLKLAFSSSLRDAKNSFAEEVRNSLEKVAKEMDDSLKEPPIVENENAVKVTSEDKEFVVPPENLVSGNVTPSAPEEPLVEEGKKSSENVATRVVEEMEFVVPPLDLSGAREKPSAPEDPEEPRFVVGADIVKAEVAKEESFSHDAEGSGEVALAVGETMDALANVINQISAELARTSGEDASQTEGSVILAGGENESQNSWDFVDDDEALARAAQVIGSALFESGVGSRLSDRTNGTSAMLGSGLSSVPTVTSVQPAETEVSPPLSLEMNRWAAQLAKLQEIGFDDVQRNVEIMERLEAAAIGCGESSEISVEQVVNELMRDW